MMYYKLKISLKNYENKLNRTILFNYDNDLDELAFTIISIFNTQARHLYKFEDDVNEYECKISLLEANTMNYPEVGFDTTSVTLEQLETKDDKFTMTYDFGENYKFVIEILEFIESNEKYTVSKVIDGIGYGIIEDERDVLERYLDGEFLEKPLLFVKRGKNPITDFNHFDLEKCNTKLKRELSKIRNSYLSL